MAARLPVGSSFFVRAGPLDKTGHRGQLGDHQQAVFDPNWNYDGMIDDAQLGFYAGAVDRETLQLPAWNPGDEFEAAKKKALGTVKGK